MNTRSKQKMTRIARESEIVFNSDTERVLGAETSNTDVRLANGGDNTLSQRGAEALSYMNHKEISLLNTLRADATRKVKKAKHLQNTIPRLVHDEALELMNQQFLEHSADAQQHEMLAYANRAADSVDLSKDLK